MSYETTYLTGETDSYGSIENKTEARPRKVKTRDVTNRRREFHRQSSIFQSILVDWEIPFDRLSFESKPLPGGRFGTKCYLGKWHGECNIRSLKV